MLAVDYYERIGELVARAVLEGCYVSIYSHESHDKIMVTIIPRGTHDNYTSEAEILWPTEIGALEATVEALTRALGEM